MGPIHDIKTIQKCQKIIYALFIDFKGTFDNISKVYPLPIMVKVRQHLEIIN
jgi:hypothetical protein